MSAMKEEYVRALTARLESMRDEAREQWRGDEPPGDDAARDPDERAEARRLEEIAEGRRETAHDALKAIEHALDRIRTGLYGRCTRCGCAIAPARLFALPTTEHCTVCQAILEAG